MKWWKQTWPGSQLRQVSSSITPCLCNINVLQLQIWSGVLLGMGFAGQVPVVGYTRLGGDRPHSLSQASIGRHSTFRECLQVVQCMLEKAKTNNSPLSPKAVIHISCNWAVKDACVRVYTDTYAHFTWCKHRDLHYPINMFGVFFNYHSLLILQCKHKSEKGPLGKCSCCFLPMVCLSFDKY